MWDQIWKYAIDHYIFHAVIIAGLAFLVLFLIFGPKKYKKIVIGKQGLELNSMDEAIDPNTDCPYKKSRDITFGAIRDIESKVGKVEGKVDKLSSEMREIIAMVKNMSIDDQKSYFYDRNQPPPERLVAGLKYIHQGGNGLTKPDVVKFAEANKDIYNALTKAKPEWRLVFDKQEGA